MNKLQYVLKGVNKILVHFPMYLISLLCQLLSFVMMILFFVTFLSLLLSKGEMGDILQQLVGLNKGVSICIVLIGTIVIGTISGGIGIAIEKYLSEHK